MAYAAQQDMIDRFSEAELIAYTDLADPPVGAIDTAKLNGFLSDASDVVDSYVSARYRVPLDPVPAIIVGLVCDLARAKMQASGPGGAREDVATNAAAAIAMLKDISASRASLQSAGVAETAAPSGGVLIAKTEERVFDHLRDYDQSGRRSHYGTWCG